MMLSIVTPSYNSIEFIREAIESVLAQNYPDLEHIVVDGGSTDGTLDILHQYPHLTVISEPDRGMYDALNKGLMHARGGWLGFLNSDDLYKEGVFNILKKFFLDPRLDSIAGNAEVFEGTSAKSNIISTFMPGPENNLARHTILSATPVFNAYFFRRKIFEKIGDFASKYKIVADREFMLRYALGGFRRMVLPQTIYRYRKHAASMTFSITEEKFQRIVNEHLDMSESYMQKNNLAKNIRLALIESRTYETMHACKQCLQAGDWNSAWLYARAGQARDHLWILRFLRTPILSSLWRKFRSLFQNP
jgi:glycosyltransferase involved in cell wall biosynthesis